MSLIPENELLEGKYRDLSKKYRKSNREIAKYKLQRYIELSRIDNYDISIEIKPKVNKHD